jgi:site-specific DNA-methyltransferase (adenine-specific)
MGRRFLEDDAVSERPEGNTFMGVHPSDDPAAFPLVAGMTDQFTPTLRYLVVATKTADRYFDLDAVREEHKHDYSGWASTAGDYQIRRGTAKGDAATDGGPRRDNPAGAPPLDWWEIPTQPYAGSHYATFPTALCVRPIKAMCPQKVCRVCGEPSRRVTGEPEYVNARTGKAVDKADWVGDGELNRQGAIGRDNGSLRVADTVGWSDCGHDDWRNGVVLDPFAGSGTTLEVATGHGRDAIGIDLDPRNLDLARQRIGMFLTEAA